MSEVSAGRYVQALLKATGCEEPRAAVRLKATAAIERYLQHLGEPEFPLHVEALASILGISMSAEQPKHSRDAELVPTTGGRVEIRVAADSPDTRRRFSIAHEISHTFFPDYAMKTWCRPDARHRRQGHLDDLIETLCDIGAAQLLMPDPWFASTAARVERALDLVALATQFGVSREAAIRRFVEGSHSCCAAVFFSWKLKPKQHRTIGQKNQQRLFGDVDEEIANAKRLRVDYSIPSRSFAATGRFVPTDKSVSLEGPLQSAATSGRPSDGHCFLDLGAAAGRYRASVVALWTADDDLGPNGESSVAAVVQPLDALERTQADGGERLFGNG